MTALDIYDLYRALYSFKHIFTYFNDEPVKLVEISRVKNRENIYQAYHAGRIDFSWKTKTLMVWCADGNCIEVHKLIVGKKTLSASDFNNGYLRKINEPHRRKFDCVQS
jgi:methionyl-tRNA formyltransferase